MLCAFKFFLNLIQILVTNLFTSKLTRAGMFWKAWVTGKSLGGCGFREHYTDSGNTILNSNQCWSIIFNLDISSTVYCA